MDKFGWTIEELKKTPLSSITKITELMEWEKKERERNQR